jgi:DNA-binding GntR family transcriptional regulator
VIDLQEGSPAWRQVADDLLERVEAGAYPPGSLLRAESDLAHDYDVGERTVRQALRQLAADGVLYLRSGFRALVRHRERRLVVVHRGAELEIRHPSRREQREHQLNASATVVVVKLGEREPEVYEAYSTRFKASS